MMDGGLTSAGHDLAADVLNMMEQGILVWSEGGICEMHNLRIFEVLELEPGDLRVGMSWLEFRERGRARGEISDADNQMSERKIASRESYSYDRHLPSGRVVLTSARPARGGAYIVTFTDVTKARRAARDIVEAKHAAEEAEARAREVLETERARQAEAGLLARLDEWLQSCKSLDELYLVVTRFMEKLLPGSKGELYIYSNSRDALDGTCNWNTDDLHHAIAADSCWALRRGRYYAYGVQEISFMCDHVSEHNHDVDVDEYICVPIVAHGDTVGLLHIRFASVVERHSKVTDHIQFAKRCGEHISMAIANVKLRDELHDQSIRDPLTGLYNRRYFLDAIRRQIAVAERLQTPFSVIAFDADKFKMFNDNHGHDAGDAVLRSLGGAMLDVMEEDAICARFGGEEFCILLPDRTTTAAVAAAEKLRKAVQEMQVRYLDVVLPTVTVSLGVASYPDCGSQPQQIMRRADDALYRAKDAGRNRVESCVDD